MVYKLNVQIKNALFFALEEIVNVMKNHLKMQKCCVNATLFCPVTLYSNLHIRNACKKELRKVGTSKLMEHGRLLLARFKNVKTMSKVKSLKMKRSTCNILVTEVYV